MTDRSSRRAYARLEHLYGFAIRHTTPNRAQVLREVAHQTLRHGPAFVVGRCSREAELFVSWGHQVFLEVYRAQRRIRFERVQRKRELAAQWHFQFPVVDLVLRHFHHQIQDHTLVLVDGDRAYIHDGCGIRLEHATTTRGVCGQHGAVPVATTFDSGTRAIAYPR